MPKATRRARKRALPRDRCPCAVRQVLVVGRVVLNAPSEMPPPHRRPSWNSWIRPSLTKARPSKARQVSVPSLCPSLSVASCASVCRPLSVRQKSVGKSVASPPRRRPSRHVSNRQHPTNARPSDVRRASVQSPCASANAEGAKGEHEANAAATRHSSVRGANAKRARREPQANAARAKAVCRPESVPRSHVASPWFVRHASIARTTNVRCSNRQTTERRREHSAPLIPHDKRPFQVRHKSVARPCPVRSMSVYRPCAVR